MTITDETGTDQTGTGATAASATVHHWIGGRAHESGSGRTADSAS